MEVMGFFSRILRVLRICMYSLGIMVLFLVKKREVDISGTGSVKLHIMVRLCPITTYGSLGSTTTKKRIRDY